MSTYRHRPYRAATSVPRLVRQVDDAIKEIDGIKKELDTAGTHSARLKTKLLALARDAAEFGAEEIAVAARFLSKNVLRDMNSADSNLIEAKHQLEQAARRLESREEKAYPHIPSPVKAGPLEPFPTVLKNHWRSVSRILNGDLSRQPGALRARASEIKNENGGAPDRHTEALYQAADKVDDALKALDNARSVLGRAGTILQRAG